MSKLLITKYHNQLHEILSAGGARNEGAITFAFANLLRSYAEKKNLLLVEQKSITSRKGTSIRPDGTIKYFGGIDLGYWEAKDGGDKLDYEIDKKLNKDGYPDKNIIFEDTQTAVLFQEGAEVMRVSMAEWNLLDDLLDKFIGYEPSEVKEFNKALERFKEDVPDIVKGLRELMEKEAETNKSFREMRDLFLEIARSEINPEITPEDVREMVIQHILTEDIFTNVFGDADFHKFNNIAKELENVIETFMSREVRKNYLSSIENYYKTIRDAASGITDNHEKQKFLKTVYENFYKVYNPKGADKLGVVYTPNEIVRFMIDATDWLLDKHFNKTLSDKGVDILDPATGTGTFIAELIDRINIHDLEYKYQNELHANEVAILPYYIANLNIEYTYQQRKGEYKEFQNICFVDTLDNVEALEYSGKQLGFSYMSKENAKRIKEQNEKKISVIIGNPPYRESQANFNDFNSNRKYPKIDERIKNTFVKLSTAQKAKSYDMYSRFYRWSMDRLDKNGIIAFVSNNSFIDASSYDGFRKFVSEEFNEVYLINLKGDARTSGERRKKEGGNVFYNKIREGIAICFLIKSEDKNGCRIYYNEVEDYLKDFQKRDYLREHSLKSLKFDLVNPDSENNWINLAENNDFKRLLQLGDKKNKKGEKKETSVFKLFSLGIATNRDAWVYDFNQITLKNKIDYFIKGYEKRRKVFFSKSSFEKSEMIENSNLLNEFLGNEIKFTRELIERDFLKNKEIRFDYRKIIKSAFRAFVTKSNYFDSEHRITHEPYKNKEIFGKFGNSENITICINTNDKGIRVLATNLLPDLHFIGDSQCFPLYRYDSQNQKHENITDWALNQFQAQYKSSNGAKITKEDIFYYVYAVLHSPVYRKKYEQNLKREFPRVPFYDDFFQWRDWGKELMDLHINYETQEPFDLTRNDLKPSKKQADLFAGKENSPFEAKLQTKLRALKTEGKILIDSITTLSGVPSEAWEYKLGNRSAIEWILDQYKEKTPSDQTIREQFNTYKFADYKEQVIDLIKRVANVSVKTMEIIDSMPNDD